MMNVLPNTAGVIVAAAITAGLARFAESMNDGLYEDKHHPETIYKRN